MTKMDKLEQEIQEKQRQLQKLKDEQKYLEMSGPEYILAVELHEKLCHSNHTDGCGWYYAVRDGKHDWGEWAHEKYLKKACQLLATGLDSETILEVVEIL